MTTGANLFSTSRPSNFSRKIRRQYFYFKEEVVRLVNDILDSLDLAEPEIPKRLYHYTGPQGLIGIVSTDSIWATDIHFLSDTKEFQYALDALETWVNAGKRDEEDPDPEICETLLDRADRGSDMRVFVFSLSSERDLLSQWRAYCPPSKGYAVGFDFDGLVMAITGTDFSLANCVYDREAHRRIVQHVTREVVARHRGEDGDVDAGAAANEFVETFVQVAPLLKHPSFEEEHEWRLVSQPVQMEDDRVGHREGPMGVVPYVRFDLTDDEGNTPMKEILVGPTPDPMAAMDGVMSLVWNEHGVMDVEIGRSDTPFRDFG